MTLQCSLVSSEVKKLIFIKTNPPLLLALSYPPAPTPLTTEKANSTTFRFKLEYASHCPRSSASPNTHDLCTDFSEYTLRMPIRVAVCQTAPRVTLASTALTRVCRLTRITQKITRNANYSVTTLCIIAHEPKKQGNMFGKTKTMMLSQVGWHLKAPLHSSQGSRMTEH